MRANSIDSEVLSRKVSGNTQLVNMHEVDVKIAPSNQKRTCGNATFAARHSTNLSIVDGVQSTGNIKPKWYDVIVVYTLMRNSTNMNKHTRLL